MRTRLATKDGTPHKQRLLELVYVLMVAFALGVTHHSLSRFQGPQFGQFLSAQVHQIWIPTTVCVFGVLGLFEKRRALPKPWILGIVSVLVSWFPFYGDFFKSYCTGIESWRIIFMSAPIYLGTGLTSYWTTSHDTRSWAFTRLAFFCVILFQRTPLFASWLQSVAHGTCDSLQIAASLLMITTSIQMGNNSFYHDEDAVPPTFKNKGLRTRNFEDDRMPHAGIPLLMFIASGSVLFLTHSHHAGITVKQCTRHWQPEPSQFDGMQLIAHAESNTGFISIVNVPSDHGLFRVMRCDHSIIGGGYLDYNLDSIFGSFYFMDFVRYITRKEDTKQVLQIGLGIGVSARTLLKTGYQVDIVELDPKVYDYAKKYFDLPEPRSYYIGDGRYYVDAIAQNQTYDFVLHDVFTGGLVPKTLFSIECMASIKRILKPNGVLAVNFVGNSHSEGTLVVLKTLKEIFKTVAIFTEPQAEESEFFNMVIYCSSMNEIGFEFPDEDEIPFKGTYQSVLGQFAHSHLKMPDLEGKQVITDKHNPLEKLQVDSARAHWKVMRQVLKEAFWMEMY